MHGFWASLGTHLVDVAAGQAAAIQAGAPPPMAPPPPRPPTALRSAFLPGFTDRVLGPHARVFPYASSLGRPPAASSIGTSLRLPRPTSLAPPSMAAAARDFMVSSRRDGGGGGKGLKRPRHAPAMAADSPYSAFKRDINDRDVHVLRSFGISPQHVSQWMDSRRFSVGFMRGTPPAGGAVSHLELARRFFQGDDEIKLKVVPNTDDYSGLTGKNVVDMFQGMMDTLLDTVLPSVTGRVMIRINFASGQHTEDIVVDNTGGTLGPIDVMGLLTETYDDDPDEDYDLEHPDTGDVMTWSESRMFWNANGAFLRGAKVGGPDANRRDQTPVSISVHIMRPPSGGGRPRAPRVSGNLMTGDLFTDNPKMWSKSVLDCGTTDGFEDCATRCLSFLYMHKTGRRITQSERDSANVNNDMTNTAKATYFRRYRTNSSSSMTKNGIFIDSSYLRTLVGAGAGAMNVSTLEGMCCPDGLGINSRIRVWTLSADGPHVVLTTDDRRQATVADPSLAWKKGSKSRLICSTEADFLREEDNSMSADDGQSSLDGICPQLVIAEGGIDAFSTAPERQQSVWYHILLHNDHYYAVLKPSYMFGKRRFCDDCQVTFTVEDRHMCAVKCAQCYSRDCDRDSSLMIDCRDCNRRFYGMKCYETHKAIRIRGRDNGHSVCEMRWECNSVACAGRVFDSKAFNRAAHKCGDVVQCWACQKYVPRGHHSCCIRRPLPKTLPKTPEVFYYDFETMTGNGGEHVVCHAVVQDSDGSATHHFKNIEDFCEFAFEGLGEGSIDRRYVAHNGGRFDVILVVRNMMTKCGYSMDRIVRGRNHMYVQFSIPSSKHPHEESKNAIDGKSQSHPQRGKYWSSNLPSGSTLTFIDSMNFIGGPLRNFPKTFGFKVDDGVKGEFPYLFAREDNFSYVGCIPHVQEFGVDTMTDSRLKEFLPWYYRRLRETCDDAEKADHAVACISFTFRQIIGDHALESAESSGIKFVAPWSFEHEMSSYCEADVVVLRLGCEKFRKTMREMVVKKNETNKTMMVHGDSIAPGDSLPSMDPFSFITVASFVQQIFLRYFYVDKQLWSFTREQETFMREGFSGGRTEAFCLYRKVTDSNHEHIMKVDFTSQYPHINKHGIYPVGTPTVIGAEFKDDEYKDLTQYTLQFLLSVDADGGLDKVGNPTFINGLFVCRCSYTPPADLKIPVLWHKVKTSTSRRREHATHSGTHKLVFDLTPRKAVVVNSIEMYEALKRGYVFSEVTEVLWWPMSSCVHGLFAEYVNTFLRMKIGSDGWPSSCITQEMKSEYVDKLNETNVGLGMTSEHVCEERNPVLRAVAKICLNSLWGKFNQRSNMTKTRLVYPHEYALYWGMMTDEDLICKLTVLIPETVAELRYTNVAEAITMAPRTCISVGVFTTAQARMMLYRKMSQLQEDQVMYVDTDSIMYFYDERNAEHVMLSTSENVLGDLSDEFSGKDGKKCVEFVSGGPKNYGYLFIDPKDPTNKARWSVDLKIKGFNLHAGASDPYSSRNMLTYDSVKSLVIGHALSDDENKKNGCMAEASKLCLDRQSVACESNITDEDMDDERNIIDTFLRMSLRDNIPVIDTRFVKTKDMRIVTTDVERRYNYVYNKAAIDINGSTPYYIRTLPFGHKGPVMKCEYEMK